jgi:hypothetical protein
MARMGNGGPWLSLSLFTIHYSEPISKGEVAGCVFGGVYEKALKLLNNFPGATCAGMLMCAMDSGFAG